MVDRYAELYRRYRWTVPERYNIAAACCGQWAAERSRFALYWEDESGASAAYSFWDIQLAANRLSNALAALGVKRGDRVALILPQRPETAIAYIAIFQMGAIALPLSHLFGPDALEYRLSHAEASVALVEPTTIANLWAIKNKVPTLKHIIGVAGARESGVLAYEELLAKASSSFQSVDTAANDPALIVYTSGTTGPPKGALKAVPEPRKKYELNLRSIMSAGESVGVTVFEWAKAELGVTINEMFGQTEINYVVGNCQSAWPAKPGSIGRPYPGHRVAVIDDQGRELPPGELGEIAINRSVNGQTDPVFLVEYCKNPQATSGELVRHRPCAAASRPTSIRARSSSSMRCR